MVVTAIVGSFVDGERYFVQHFALGLSATFFICLCHCVVLTYFMATGKMMRLAVQEASLDVKLAAETQRLKVRAYGVLMPGILMALLAAFSGGWATNQPEHATVHLTMALLSTAFQLLAFYVEYTMIVANGKLMDAIFVQHEAAKRGLA